MVLAQRGETAHGSVRAGRMRVVLQRVLSGRVEVGGRVTGEIGAGAVALVGCEKGDTAEDVAWVVKKVVSARMWESAEDVPVPWKRSLGSDPALRLLCVSQFTLLGRLKGNKPDWSLSAPADQARDLYSSLLLALAAALGPERIHDGEFQAHMDVTLTNHGPVTLTLDSRRRDVGF